MTLPKPRKIQIERYVEGLSQFKKIDNPIKLSANESALGPSPRVIEAFEREKDKIFKYKYFHDINIFFPFFKRKENVKNNIIYVFHLLI